jgi:hypothetical protein
MPYDCIPRMANDAEREEKWDIMNIDRCQRRTRAVESDRPADGVARLTPPAGSTTQARSGRTHRSGREAEEVEAAWSSR